MAGIGIAGSLLAGASADAAFAAGKDGYLFVVSYGTDSVLRYNGKTGAFVDSFVKKSGGLRQPIGIIVGPDGNLYVTDGLDTGKNSTYHNVLRYDGDSGAFIDDFADSGQVQSPRSVLFGPDGNLYVACGSSKKTSAVQRFNGVTGAFIDSFVAPRTGGYRNPAGMVFGPDGTGNGTFDLYTSILFTNEILRYDGATGVFKGVYVSPGSGGLSWPFGITFGPDGNLYVASYTLVNEGTTFPPGAVLCYEGPAGRNPVSFLGVFVPPGSGGLSTPTGILFGPGGDLYVTSTLGYIDPNTSKFVLVGTPGTNQVLRYNGKTGQFKGVFVSPDSGGLSYPMLMAFTGTDPTTLDYIA